MTETLFPSESLHDILSNLDTNSLINCQIVNKQWYHMASRELQQRSHKIVGKFKNNFLSGYAVYAINPITGEISQKSIAEENTGLNYEELCRMSSILFDNESNIRAKLRGVYMDSYQNYFTILKQDSFMSKKNREIMVEEKKIL